jgi:SpoVK/Ycf46/Vps4 family AAA+-type ATPase
MNKSNNYLEVSGDVAAIQSHTTAMSAVVNDLSLVNQSDRIKRWLSPPDPSTNLNEAQKKRQNGTGSWFLKSKPYKQWKAGKHQHLWLHGIPGCGKTILSATIIDDLNQKPDSSCIVLNFFFDFTDTDKQSLDKLVRSLITQLYSRCRESRKELDKLFASYDNGERQPTFESLSTAFMRMTNYVEKVQVIIDALDECKTRSDLISWMENITRSEHAGLQLITTSRREEDIESRLKRWLHQRNTISIQQEITNFDIRLYIHKRLKEPDFELWQSQPSVLDEIETRLMEKADGM